MVAKRHCGGSIKPALQPAPAAHAAPPRGTPKPLLCLLAAYDATAGGEEIAAVEARSFGPIASVATAPRPAVHDENAVRVAIAKGVIDSDFRGPIACAADNFSIAVCTVIEEHDPVTPFPTLATHCNVVPYVAARPFMMILGHIGVYTSKCIGL